MRRCAPAQRGAEAAAAQGRAHLVQPRLPAAEREDEAQGQAVLRVADFLQETLHALCDEVKEL